MTNKSVALALLFSATLAGCQTPDRRMGPPPSGASTQQCRGATCDIEVSVVDGCTIRVVDVVDTREGPSTQILRWNLQTTGYKFSSDPVSYGIVIKDSTGQFHGDPFQPTRIMVQFKHKEPPTRLYHDYGINVVRPDGTPCPTKDPWVWE